MKFNVPPFLTDKYVPRLEAVNLLEYFLISAITSLLVIRVYLSLTGFPQIGGGGLHIAHMLWGGLFMTIALIMFASFLNAHSRVIAMIIGGIGFGTFIDELGKFITSDNNYFFQPTIAIIYVIFICLYLLTKSLANIAVHSQKTYAANAVEALKELVILDLDKNERSIALYYLSKIKNKDDVASAVYEIIKKSEHMDVKVSLFRRFLERLYHWYSKTINIKLVSRIMIIYFISTTILSTVASIILLIFGTNITFNLIGYFVSTIFVTYYLVRCIYYRLNKRMLHFYKGLEKAILISIFLSQFFLFLEDQLFAITTLILYISIYLVVKIAISAHERIKVENSLT